MQKEDLIDSNFINLKIDIKLYNIERNKGSKFYIKFFKIPKKILNDKVQENDIDKDNEKKSKLFKIKLRYYLLENLKILIIIFIFDLFILYNFIINNNNYIFYKKNKIYNLNNRKDCNEIRFSMKKISHTNNYCLKLKKIINFNNIFSIKNYYFVTVASFISLLINIYVIYTKYNLLEKPKKWKNLIKSKIYLVEALKYLTLFISSFFYVMVEKNTWFLILFIPFTIYLVILFIIVVFKFFSEKNDYSEILLLIFNFWSFLFILIISISHDYKINIVDNNIKVIIYIHLIFYILFLIVSFFIQIFSINNLIFTKYIYDFIAFIFFPFILITFFIKILLIYYNIKYVFHICLYLTIFELILISIYLIIFKKLIINIKNIKKNLIKPNCKYNYINLVIPIIDFLIEKTTTLKKNKSKKKINLKRKKSRKILIKNLERKNKKENNRKKKTLNPEDLCIMCYENKSNSIIIRCLHNNICEFCIKKLWLLKDECHICKRKISKVLVYKINNNEVEIESVILKKVLKNK